jgi:diacylglycerol kinase family enzyme
VIVILNRAAGNSSGTTDGGAEEIGRFFAAASVKPRIVQPDANNDLAAIAREAAAGPEEVVVAGGGDGTISAVASALAATPKILGVLPLGTLNHFAKDLGIPLEIPAAVQTIVGRRVTEVDVGEVNGRIFINNSSLGIYPDIVARREAEQKRPGRAKWPAFLWATLLALHRFPFLNLQITLEGKQLTRKTAFLFIGNNEYEIAGFRLGGRACLNAGKLGLYMTQRTGRFGLFRLGLNALMGRLDQAEDFAFFCVEEATIEARQLRLLVATDGEVTSLQTPLHYRILPCALRVIVPQTSGSP